MKVSKQVKSNKLYPSFTKEKKKGKNRDVDDFLDFPKIDSERNTHRNNDNEVGIVVQHV